MLNNKKQQESGILELPMNRKGQGISINVIIIAAIALLVLVILSVLLLRSGGELVTDCSDIDGGICSTSASQAASDAGNPDGLYVKYEPGRCTDTGQSCYVPVKR